VSLIENNNMARNKEKASYVKVIWHDRSPLCHYPARRVCRNVILRPKPKNLGLITHRFYEILHFVRNDKSTFQGNCDTASRPDNPSLPGK
jgi:hypothetical protein